jgi:hypothetical protein
MVDASQELKAKLEFPETLSAKYRVVGFVFWCGCRRVIADRLQSRLGLDDVRSKRDGFLLCHADDFHDCTLENSETLLPLGKVSIH